MGLYINPPNEPKEEFLRREGVPLPWPQCAPEDAWDFSSNTKVLPVVWVNNGGFTAAAICPDVNELSVFLDPADKRPKQLFIVPKAKLEAVSDEYRIYLEHKGR